MLDGRTALVIETEFIIAFGVQSVLETMGANPVEIARNAAEARSRLASGLPVSVVVLGLDSGNTDRVELARELVASGVAVVCMTADAILSEGVPGLPDTPVLLKPVPDEEIGAAVLRALDRVSP